MTTVSVQARISPELKNQADAILAALGLSTADAIRIFLQQVVNSEGLPFQPTLKRPNALTRSAIQELENGGRQVFKTTNDLLAEMDGDDTLPVTDAVGALAAVQRLTTLFADLPVRDLETHLSDPMLALANIDLDLLLQ